MLVLPLSAKARRRDSFQVRHPHLHPEGDSAWCSHSSPCPSSRPGRIVSLLPSVLTRPRFALLFSSGSSTRSMVELVPGSGALVPCTELPAWPGDPAPPLGSAPPCGCILRCAAVPAPQPWVCWPPGPLPVSTHSKGPPWSHPQQTPFR